MYIYIYMYVYDHAVDLRAYLLAPNGFLLYCVLPAMVDTLFPRLYRGTSLIRNSQPPRISIGPWA